MKELYKIFFRIIFISSIIPLLLFIFWFIYNYSILNDKWFSWECINHTYDLYDCSISTHIECNWLIPKYKCGAFEEFFNQTVFGVIIWYSYKIFILFFIFLFVLNIKKIYVISKWNK